MLPRLAATLSLPFPADSCIQLWQPRLREYRQEQIDFLEALIALWRQCGRSLGREIVEDIVAEYLLGMKLRQFVALDAEYAAPTGTIATGSSGSSNSCSSTASSTSSRRMNE